MRPGWRKSRGFGSSQGGKIGKSLKEIARAPSSRHAPTVTLGGGKCQDSWRYFPRLLGGSPLSECRNGFADASRALQWARPSRDPPWETAGLGGSAAAWAAREMPGFPRAGPGGRRKGGGGANLRGAETGGDLGPLAAAGRSPGGTSRGCSAAPLCQNVETVLQTPPGPSDGLDRHAILRGKRPGLEDLRRLGPPGKCRDFPGPARAGGGKGGGGANLRGAETGGDLGPLAAAGGGRRKGGGGANWRGSETGRLSGRLALRNSLRRRF